ncbi:hypothetical protein ACFQ2K_06120 [Streptomyces sanglieri]|uniref:Uncharacterized protein n=1 Tax=Streptomyces sanglieri TaxID=193460 RepID=A0ABW2WMT3_9ACTN
MFAPEHCVVVADPTDQATVGAALSRAVRECEDLLLVYYCGHGLLDEAGLLHLPSPEPTARTSVGPPSTSIW